MDTPSVKIGDSRETGAPGRRVLAVAAWRTEDRELRALLGQLKELVPCEFDILNLDSPTAARYRSSSRPLYDRIRRYDAVVFAVCGRDGAASPVLQLPDGSLPALRCLARRIPAAYITDGEVSKGLEAAAADHARAWRLRSVGVASDKGGDEIRDLAAALRNSINL